MTSRLEIASTLFDHNGMDSHTWWRWRENKHNTCAQLGAHSTLLQLWFEIAPMHSSFYQNRSGTEPLRLQYFFLYTLLWLQYDDPFHTFLVRSGSIGHVRRVSVSDVYWAPMRKYDHAVANSLNSRSDMARPPVVFISFCWLRWW